MKTRNCGPTGELRKASVYDELQKRLRKVPKHSTKVEQEEESRQPSTTSWPPIVLAVGASAAQVEKHELSWVRLALTAELRMLQSKLAANPAFSSFSKSRVSRLVAYGML